VSIGLTGSHRTGKSTLAKAFSEQMKVPFLQTSASETFKRLNFDPKADYSLSDRLYIQHHILDDCRAMYAAAGMDCFVTDRTPIDMMAYTLADVTRENVTPQLDKEIENYMKDCFDVSNAYFPMLFVVQPGIPLVEEVGKAPANPAYVEHINSLIMGLVIDDRYLGSHFYLPRKTTGLQDRVSALAFSYDRMVKRHAVAKQSAVESGQLGALH
jgi:hypothetical protein